MEKNKNLDLKRVKLMYPDLDVTATKLIGWGAGNEFNENYLKLGLEIEYTICIYEENWEKTIHGVNVQKPEALLSENTETTLIVVFSSWWFDVFRQIKDFGNFKCIRAFSGWSDEHEKSIEILKETDLNKKTKVTKNNECAILFQGPIDVYTSMALQITKKITPDVPILLSTWIDEDPIMLKSCENFVDFKVLLKKPKSKGPNGTNLSLQQTGVLAGLRKLDELGFKYALKTRTDTSIYGQLDFNTLINLSSRKRKSQFGLNNRILFSGSNCWKYIPYHLTDQYHFGYIDDLINYWSFSNKCELSNISRDEAFYYFSLGTPESLICRAFLANNSTISTNIKYPIIDLKEYWRILKEEFGLLPEPELTFCKWKSISISSLNINNKKSGLMDTISIDWYKEIGSVQYQKAKKMMLLDFSISDFASNKNVIID